jgi:hypothetical protein
MCMCFRCQVLAEIDAEEIRREVAAMWATAIAFVAERYRLDDADALRHVRLHAINGPGVSQ